MSRVKFEELLWFQALPGAEVQALMSLLYFQVFSNGHLATEEYDVPPRLSPPPPVTALLPSIK